MTMIKVHLRQRLMRSGNISLYLDFYPNYFDKTINKSIRRKALGQLYNPPKNDFEIAFNKSLTEKCEAIRDKYCLDIIDEEYGLNKRTQSFLDYFHRIAKNEGTNSLMAYLHFEIYINGKCTFGDLNSDLCQGFSDYLLRANQIKSFHKKLSHNSAAVYFRKFRAVLKKAYRDKFITQDINEFLEIIKEIRPKKISDND